MPTLLMESLLLARCAAAEKEQLAAVRARAGEGRVEPVIQASGCSTGVHAGPCSRVALYKL